MPQWMESKALGDPWERPELRAGESRLGLLACEMAPVLPAQLALWEWGPVP
jgi:hypothetical protein